MAAQRGEVLAISSLPRVATSWTKPNPHEDVINEWSCKNGDLIKRMRRQCAPGVLSPLLRTPGHKAMMG